ncbi:hypothetical protein MASR2M78_11280 [Treponema sp.]
MLRWHQELLDHGFFFTALIIASLLGYSTKRIPVPHIVMPPLLLLLPFLVRLFLHPDSLLLSYDRNLFVSLLPFYWAALSAFLAQRYRGFLRAEQAGNILFLAILFSIAPGQIDTPILLIAYISLLLLVQLAILLLSSPIRLSTRKKTTSLLLVAGLILIAALSLIQPYEEKAVERGGGLIKPSLFRFDFSQFLRLESEISLSDDLVLITHKDPNNDHILLRRFVLSAYEQKKGFYRDPVEDEKVQAEHLKDAPRESQEPSSLREIHRYRQEYFLVNFDPDSFIALNQPVQVVPYKSWDSSSFNAAYAVESDTSDALPFELIDAVPPNYTQKTFNLNKKEYERYTHYGEDIRIRELAIQMSEGLDGYWDRIQAIYEHLKYGEYSYSLKPGLASNGDQLGRFLFESKKGYCSYFAFSMALLVRSLGVPARIAVGFFIDPSTGTLDYYPVRSDMAHAWVEVYFPSYGWIAYDPTTDQLAEGEDFRFSSGVPPELFERLMKEILEKRTTLSPQDSLTDSDTNYLSNLVATARASLSILWPYLLSFLLILFIVYRKLSNLLKSKLSRTDRKKTIYLARHCFKLLSSCGIQRKTGETYTEFALRCDADFDLGIGAIERAFTKAKFSASFENSDLKQAKQDYIHFKSLYRKEITLIRRFMSWIFPPNKQHTFFSILLSLILLAGNGSIGAQEPIIPSDLFFEEATIALNAELWDTAIERLQGGEKAYPDEPRFPVQLGNLYADKGLYSLAKEEYKKAEQLSPNDPSLLYSLSLTSGRLNQDADSAGYLERVIALRNDDRDAIGDLGWMYFKLHRLREGEHLLLETIDRLGFDRGFSMTLGTIYSDLYEYEASKKQYLDAIRDAESEGAKTFAAVAHYNLSILESRFYHYEEAYKQAELSLKSAERASGNLALGELLLKRLDFPKTFAAYHAANELDTSPLSKVNIADAYRQAGNLDEARAYAEKALSYKDASWMLNYGTDLVQHKRDLHQILMDVYAGLAEIQKSSPTASVQGYFRNLSRRLSYSVLGTYHRLLYYRACGDAGRSYDREGRALDAQINYYNAYKGYPRRALSYLREAREIEKSSSGLPSEL